MLCRNSPLGRLNFFMLSADADANAFLKKGCYIKVHNIEDNIENQIMDKNLLLWMKRHSSDRLFMVCKGTHSPPCRRKQL